MYINDIGRVDPEFFGDYDTDPGFDDPGYHMCGEDDEVFDTYDEIIDPGAEIELSFSESEIDDLSAEGLAIALAFGEDLAKTESSKYDINKDTDRENLEQALSLNRRLFSSSSKLRPFEQHVKNYIGQHRSI